MTAVPQHVVFVVPFFMAATLRFVAAAADLDGVRLSIVSQDPLESLPPGLRSRVVGHWRIADGLDASQIVGAVQELGRRFGPVQRLVASLEQLQEPLAIAAAQLGLPGLDPLAARRCRDKLQMKDAFTQAGVPCARYAQIGDAAAARAFASTTGLPLVAKPLAGAGARNTFRIDSAATLERYLERHPPQPAQPVLFEEFLRGREHSWDAVLLHGEVLWRSISVYSPSTLTVLENPWIQWCVLLPRELDAAEFQRIDAIAPRALQALGLRTGLAHLEWFAREDGSVAVSEAAARPPGAQFTTLLSLAHEHDFYRAWARLMIHERFDVPERRYAAGAAYLRGLGQGRVRAIEGIDALRREYGDLIVDAHWPTPGVTQLAGYEGAGYVLLRGTDTARVAAGLRRAVELIRVKLV
jgi:hypothetical protein